MLAARVPEEDCQQVDTSALPVKASPPGPWRDGQLGRATTWPPGSAATAAHAEMVHVAWLAIKTDLGSRIVRAWSIVPAAVNEREVATDLLETGPPPRDLLLDKGFNGRAFRRPDTHGTALVSSRPPRTSGLSWRPSC